MTLAEADRYTAARLSERPSPSPGPDRRKEVDLLEFEPLDQFQQRLKKLSEIEGLGHAPYPRKFAWTHTAKEAVVDRVPPAAEVDTALRLAGFSADVIPERFLPPSLRKRILDHGREPSALGGRQT